MKNFFLILFILFAFFVEAQIEDTIFVEDSIVLQFDSLPKVSFFDVDNGNVNISRIASFYKRDNSKNIFFLSFVVYSILLCVVYLNSRAIVRSSFKTLFNIQYAMQFYRTEKYRNTIYYFVYLFFFVIGASFLIFSVYNYFTNISITFVKALAFTVAYFLIDYLSSYIYLLFMKSNKTITTVQTSMLSFSVFLCISLWPLLIFIIMGSFFVSLLAAITSITVIVLFLLIREFRMLQILGKERVNVFSFHFFAYLCTFKFLPIFILIKIYLY